jgi:hypothetical protein
MSKSISYLAALVVLAFPVIGYPQSAIPQNRQWFNFSLPMSHSVGETVEILIAVGDGPGNAKHSDTFFFSHSFTFQSSGPIFPDKAVEVDAPSGGLAKFTIEVGEPSGSDEMNLLVNGEEFCCFPVVNNRVAYRVEMRRSKKGFDAFTGKDVPIPLSTGANVAITIFEKSTGETRSSAYVLRPVIKADRFDAELE